MEEKQFFVLTNWNTPPVSSLLIPSSDGMKKVWRYAKPLTYLNILALALRSSILLGIYVGGCRATTHFLIVDDMEPTNSRQQININMVDL